MSEILARLQDALQDHYRFERELGQGGTLEGNSLVGPVTIRFEFGRLTTT